MGKRESEKGRKRKTEKTEKPRVDGLSRSPRLVASLVGGTGNGFTVFAKRAERLLTHETGQWGARAGFDRACVRGIMLLSGPDVRVICTRLLRNVTIREENAAAALEVMSRFAANPKWLVYLPPTMSPSETSKLPDVLEHPAEAFAYYRAHGVGRVVCEEKHMRM